MASKCASDERDAANLAHASVEPSEAAPTLLITLNDRMWKRSPALTASMCTTLATLKRAAVWPEQPVETSRDVWKSSRRERGLLTAICSAEKREGE